LLWELARTFPFDSPEPLMSLVTRPNPHFLTHDQVPRLRAGQANGLVVVSRFENFHIQKMVFSEI
jgi:hypothetical protein